jgi:hypothetical protein
VHHEQNDKYDDGFLCIRKCVEDIRNDISRQAINIVWNGDVFEMNQSIVGNQIPSLDVSQTWNLSDI